MINGAHTIIYSEDATAARKFFKEVLGFPAVDAGDGWLIFALPPGELAAHPIDGKSGKNGEHQLYLMCDDIEKTVRQLEAKGVQFTSPAVDHGWGILTSFMVPGGGEISMYEPRHARPNAKLKSRSKNVQKSKVKKKVVKKVRRRARK